MAEFKEKEEWKDYIVSLKNYGISKEHINYLLEKLKEEPEQLSDEFKNETINIIEESQKPKTTPKKIKPQKMPKLVKEPKVPKKKITVPKINPPKVREPSKPRVYKQDDSLGPLTNLYNKGYTNCVWHLSDAHAIPDICDELDNQDFDLGEFISGLQYSAPFHEHAHCGCKCFVTVYSKTNPELPSINIDAGDRWA
jgi:hypothetical protein